MLRTLVLSSLVIFGLTATLRADERMRGDYVEARTCQVYTGPCFANGEVGSVGKDAIMAWSINEGTFAGADLTGQSVAVVVKTSHTLGFHGLADAKTIKAILIVNSSANEQETAALRSFALRQTGLQESEIAKVERAEIDMQFDRNAVTATVEVGDFAHLETRKARKGDCICSNESAYYPPLTPLQGFVPGVTIEGEVTARRLGTRWSIPDSRTAYLGTFDFDGSRPKLASRL